MADLRSSGKQVIERMLEAYEVEHYEDLCHHLELEITTLSTWISRDHCPATLIIQCALETGANLKWLTTGKGEKGETTEKLSILAERKIVKSGAIADNDYIVLDRHFIPEHITAPLLVKEHHKTYVINKDFEDIFDGTWLVEIEEKINVRRLERIPVKRLRVINETNNDTFKCSIDDIKAIGHVVMVCEELE